MDTFSAIRCGQSSQLWGGGCLVDQLAAEPAIAADRPDALIEEWYEATDACSNGLKTVRDAACASASLCRRNQSRGVVPRRPDRLHHRRPMAFVYSITSLRARMTRPLMRLTLRLFLGLLATMGWSVATYAAPAGSAITAATQKSAPAAGSRHASRLKRYRRHRERGL